MHYGKFLPNLSTRLEPLYQFLTKDSKWKWTKAQERGISRIERPTTIISAISRLQPSTSLILACDASAVGIRAVLAHRMPDGSEKPIGYASHT